MKKQAYRHGEILLVKTSKLPKGLKVSDSKVIETGTHGHSHYIDNGEIYFVKENDFVFGYLKADNTKLFHEEHSPKGAKIDDGVYQLIKQQEWIVDGLKPIID